MSAELTELFKHNLWGNLRLLDACEKLSDEQLDATSPGTYGSIRDTLVHIASGEELCPHQLHLQRPGPRARRARRLGLRLPPRPAQNTNAGPAVGPAQTNQAITRLHFHISHP